MSVHAKKRLLTVEEYHKMGEVGILKEKGLELINGEIIERSPKGSRHSKIVKKLNKLLSALLGNELIISIQDPIIAGDYSEPEPDVAILKYRSDFYENEHPHGKDVLLVVEVSDSSAAYDRNVKLPLYAAAGVPECWIVQLEKQEIHAYWEPVGNAYKFSELVRKGEVVGAQNFDLRLEVDRIFE